MLKSLSVFFPAYNEEGNIVDTVNRAKGVLLKIVKEWEIIIVNDGSTDETGKIAESLAKEDKRIRVMSQENRGYGGALQTGFYNAKYDWICYNDADGQFDFSEITRFIDASRNADLVLGYRIKRKDSFYRLILAKGWAFCLFVTFGLKLRDVDCGFKMVKKDVINAIPHLKSERGGMINAELAINAKENGFKIKEIGVNHYPRKKGSATGANLNVIFKSFLDLFRLWIKLKLG